MESEDTIVALATPQGRGGLGVVRLSGRRAVGIVTELIRCRHLPLNNHHATLGTFPDPKTGRAIDEVVVTFFQAPHSYTAEDVVEVSCHGAPVVLRFLIECCLERGARAAEPGEFTMRAFLNGRIDLTQAEAIRDLIESRTLYQARVAAQQMEGSVSARLKPHKNVLMDLIARLEAGIDFAEDDVGVMEWAEILSHTGGIRTDLEKLVESYEYGRLVREGLTLAIVGRPNVGKSSLFNRLLNEPRAIVTSTPGTTRDLVTESASLGGIPLRFVDTAGIREAAEEAERIGVERSFQAIADSDLRLLVIDGSEPWTEEDASLLEKVSPLGALLIACNKSDLPARLTEAEVRQFATSGMPAPGANAEVVRISALTGEGLSRIREKILALATPASCTQEEGEFLTNLRHQQLIKDSVAALARAHRAAENHTPHEMLLIDLYEALHSLDNLTGATATDDLLDIVFSTFCVGK